MTNSFDNETERCIYQRHSVRAYLPDAIPRETIEAILSCARQAPSGANLQPGKFHVLVGDALSELKVQLADAISSDRPQVSEYSYFPPVMPDDLKARQRAAGYALYSALEIDRRDIKARRLQFARNYQFFDAPVGIVVTIDQNMGKGCFMDLGMALMSLFTSAKSRDLGTTGIGALSNYADVVHQQLKLPDDEMVVCGIALGVPDLEHPANTTRTEREPLDSYSQFHGFKN